MEFLTARVNKSGMLSNFNNRTFTDLFIFVCLFVFFPDSLSAEAFALIVFLCDSYLELRETMPTTPVSSISGAVRLFQVARQLPMDLQMVLCNRLYGSAKTLILTRNSEPEFVNLARIFCEQDHEAACQVDTSS